MITLHVIVSNTTTVEVFTEKGELLKIDQKVIT